MDSPEHPLNRRDPPGRDPLAQLEDLPGYRRLFTDVAFWRPYVAEVCNRLRLGECLSVRPTLPGSFPTFILNDRWVVKFFGSLFEGGQCFETELAVSRRLIAATEIPAPAVWASGNLFEGTAGWPWPYLVFEYVPASSFGELANQVPLDQKLALAAELGRIVCRLHQLPLPESSLFPPSWQVFADFLDRQRQVNPGEHRQVGSIPEQLLDQVERYLLPTSAIIPRQYPPHLIHADLTRDHILGRIEDRRWRTLALIDFGDAMVGDLSYELVALHLDLFQCDKRLLAAFLDAYGPQAGDRRELPARAMSATLLHRFDVLGPVFHAHPEWREIPDLEHLAAILWDPNV